MAIQFASADRRGWSPERLPESTREDIVSALEARWSTHVAHAQLKSAVFDILWRARKAEAYAPVLNAPPVTDHDKLQLLQQLADAPGPLASFRSEIREVVSWLHTTAPDLQAFSDGWVEVREDRRGAIKITLLRHRRRQRLSCAQFRQRAAEFSEALRLATETLRKASQNIEDLH
jgi:hypothetical protein